MPEQPENRIERIVDDLLHGRRLRLRAGDAEEKQAIIAAARLAAARSGPQRMSPAFRHRLAQILDSSPAPLPISASSPVVPRNGRWTDVGAMADFREGQGKLVRAGAVGAFVFRRGQTVTAVSSMCSHLPCELWWESGSSLLECPCHPVSFTSDGKPSSPSYTLPALNEVKVRVTAAARVEVLGT